MQEVAAKRAVSAWSPVAGKGGGSVLVMGRTLSFVCVCVCVCVRVRVRVRVCAIYDGSHAVCGPFVASPALFTSRALRCTGQTISKGM